MSRHFGAGERLACWGAAAGCLMLGTIVWSCADAPSDLGEATSDASTPDGSGASGDDDGGCEAGSDACAPREPACEGAAWCPVETNHDTRLGLVSVWGSGKDDVWAVGAAGSVIHWDGSEWTSANVDTDQALYAVWGTGPNDVWVVSSPAKMFRADGFVKGATPWRSVSAISELMGVDARGKVLRTIWGTSPSDIWIGGEPFFRNSSNESGWRSVVVDGGTSWARVTTTMPSTWTDLVSGDNTIWAIWGSGAGDVWVVGAASYGVPASGSKVMHSNGASSSTDDPEIPDWTALDTQSSSALYAIWGSGPGDVWIVGERGTIRHYAGGDAQLGSVESPTSSTLRAVWGSGPKDVWAVGDDGTILHYDGTAWTLSTGSFPPGEKPNLHGVWGSGPNDVWAVGDGIVMHFAGLGPDGRGVNP
ncbi:MAG: hypothetical protein KF850_03890 [Labilithrix sp.]|nr:hypothetical protein [Labilithrix sp.]